MDLFSLNFIILLLILLAAYYFLPKKCQWICLLVASLVFYAFSGWTNLLFIMFSAFSTWGAGVLFARFKQGFEASKKQEGVDKEQRKLLKARMTSQKRRVMWLAVIANFALLAFVKYTPAFTGMGLLFPLGISFYTFQSVGYLMDQYNEKYEPQKNFFKYLLFVSFFPQLIQGPINRYDKMGDQLIAERSFDWDICKRALFLILFGLMKKFAIANLLSGAIAYVLDAPSATIPGSAVVMAILMYSAQQYADFSGGIDLVLGIALLFGVEMMPNFRQPYFAVSLADFWRRWHISLGAWMKDYVFFPFALTKSMQKFGKWGNKKFGREIGRLLPGFLGNVLVFLIVGIWHGAQMHYVIWGLYNGLVISFAEILPPIFDRIKYSIKNKGAKITEMEVQGKTSNENEKAPSRLQYIWHVFATFIIVNIGWYFDRIESMSDCMLCFKNTIVNFKAGELAGVFNDIVANVDAFSARSLIIVGVAILFVLTYSIMSEKGIDVFDFLQKKNIFIRWGVYYFMLVLVQVSMSLANTTEAFLYAVF